MDKRQLMVNPHCEDDAQDWHTISVAADFLPCFQPEALSVLRFYLYQPSPSWATFCLDSITGWAAAPPGSFRADAAGAPDAPPSRTSVTGALRKPVAAGVADAALADDALLRELRGLLSAAAEAQASTGTLSRLRASAVAAATSSVTASGSQQLLLPEHAFSCAAAAPADPVRAVSRIVYVQPPSRPPAASAGRGAGSGRQALAGAAGGGGTAPAERGSSSSSGGILRRTMVSGVALDAD